MKSMVLLTILVLVTACTPQALPAAAPSPTLRATQTSFLTATQRAPTATPTQRLPPPTPIFDILIDNAAIGEQGPLYATGFGAYGDDLRHFAQWDDTKWTGLGNGVHTAGGALAVDSAGRPYTEILKDYDHGGTTTIVRWEGASWEDITGNFNTAVDALQAGRVSSNVPVVALAVDGEDNLYAAGSFFYPNADHTNEFPMGYVAKWNQDTWTVLGQGFDKVNIFSLAVSPSGKVYVAGEQPGIPGTELTTSGFIAEWDGETWTPIGAGKLSSCLLIKRLALDNTGGLYTSCTWNGPGELILHWNGTDWTTISDQLEGEAPGIYSMAVDPNGRLYISGDFDSVSGTAARNIASWDGSSWHALGKGINRPANALTIAPGGDVYVVGAFTEAGDLLTRYVARWDGETWHALAP